MASLGVRTIDELIGRTDLLKMDDAIDHWKARGIDLGAAADDARSCPRARRATARSRRRRCSTTTWTGRSSPTRARSSTARPSSISARAARSATRHAASAACSRRRSPTPTGAKGLPDDAIHVEFTGAAGQSFGGWLAPGVSFALHGDANDYTGKGLSGGVLAVMPPDGAAYVPEENVLIGNTVLYGATSGRAFFRGLAGERFARAQLGRDGGRRGRRRPRLRVHDRRRVVVLGAHRAQLRGRHERRRRLRPRRGRRRSARASTRRCSISSRSSTTPTARRCARWSPSTSSAPGRPSRRRVLDEFDALAGSFVKVFPTDYKRVLAARAAAADVDAGELVR